uniref:Leucine-rich repeat-containing N-terminal plant-type domain-containing protein n=1 Tax=Cannabis sativa TaxID=3483 RepID=A0A803NMH3_CANSA
MYSNTTTQWTPKGVLESWKGDNVCKYKGFICDKRPDFGLQAVAGVDFNGFKFSGKNDILRLNNFLDGLPDLAFFHVNSNNFTDGVPRIGPDKINYLFELDLSNGKLSGPFPNEVLKAINLTFLDLRFNQFYGEVPEGVFKLDVQVIFLNNNNFEGEIPSNLGITPALYLTFANNKFTGQIPSSLGTANTSKISEKFSSSTTNSLSFGCLSKIEILNFANNKLYGEVPESVCKIQSLSNFTLSDNYITQVGPFCRKLIDRKRLNLKGNCIRDLPNQKSKEECAEFFSKAYPCPNMKMMNYIPCKNQFYRKSSSLTGVTDDHQSESAIEEEAPSPAPAPSKSVTYGALSPH